MHGPGADSRMTGALPNGRMARDCLPFPRSTRHSVIGASPESSLASTDRCRRGKAWLVFETSRLIRCADQTTGVTWKRQLIVGQDGGHKIPGDAGSMRAISSTQGTCGHCRPGQAALRLYIR